MNGRRAYKSDVSFLEKISIGAVGTKKVFDDIAQKGHHPIELERGSMSFKIWKEIKRERMMSDILKGSFWPERVRVISAKNHWKERAEVAK
ncbi:MAG: hypothetical protein ACE5K2_00995 [Candidatus Zixiibacteriota bacterium]